MTFCDAPTDENFPLRHFLSEGGTWELGLVPMLFGVRVRLGKVGNSWWTLDYCAGPVVAEQFFLLGVVAGTLYWVPEETSEAELGLIFPRQRIKPMSLDKECLEALLGLGKGLSGKELV
jgi:hypothetical protein